MKQLMQNKKLKCYHAHHKDDYHGVAIIACNVREAKKLAWEYRDMFDCDWWPDMRVTWTRDANIKDLKKGIVDDQISLEETYKRGIYVDTEAEEEIY